MNLSLRFPLLMICFYIILFNCLQEYVRKHRISPFVIYLSLSFFFTSLLVNDNYCCYFLSLIKILSCHHVIANSVVHLLAKIYQGQISNIFRSLQYHLTYFNKLLELCKSQIIIYVYIHHPHRLHFIECIDWDHSLFGDNFTLQYHNFITPLLGRLNLGCICVLTLHAH